jgi:hypothetical protein
MKTAAKNKEPCHRCGRATGRDPFVVTVDFATDEVVLPGDYPERPAEASDCMVGSHCIKEIRALYLAETGIAYPRVRLSSLGGGTGH